MLKHSLILAGAAAVLFVAQPASASYTCGISADGQNVIVKVSNPDPFKKSCTVNCQFKMPGGSASVGCSNTVPANAQDYELCKKSTDGDKYTFREGDENCVKQ